MIKFFVSLNAKGRADEARRQIVDYLAGLGFEQTGGGITTLSFTAPAKVFDDVFQSSTCNLPSPLPRPPDSVGASGPFEEPQFTIPEKLEPYIQYLSIAPTARHFRDNI